jgi:hypothetical protein
MNLTGLDGKAGWASAAALMKIERRIRRRMGSFAFSVEFFY